LATGPLKLTVRDSVRVGRVMIRVSGSSEQRTAIVYWVIEGHPAIKVLSQKNWRKKIKVRMSSWITRVYVEICIY